MTNRVLRWWGLGLVLSALAATVAWRASAGPRPLSPQAQCAKSKAEIEALIEESKACSVDADCTEVAWCYSCRTRVSTSAEARLKKRIGEHDAQCRCDIMFKCARPTPVACVRSRCE